MRRLFFFALSALLCLISGRSFASSELETRGLQRFVSQTGSVVSQYDNSYALLIGNSSYQNYAWSSLESIPRELDKVADALSGQGFEILRHDNLDTVSLRQTMREFVIKYGQANNRLLVFYSGHGYTEQRGSTDVGYLVPVDAPDPNDNAGSLGTQALSMGDIVTWAKESPARHILYVFDSCFSGTVLNTRSHINASRLPPHIEHSMSEPARQFITAGAANQPVPAVSQFADAFVNGIKYQKADLSDDGYITGTELGMYIRQQVAVIGNGQTPQFGTILEPRFRLGEVLFNGGALGGYQPSVASTPTLTAPALPAATATSTPVAPLATQIPSSSSAAPAAKAPSSEPALLNFEEPKKKKSWLMAVAGAVLVGALIGGGGGSSGSAEDDSLTIRVPKN